MSEQRDEEAEGGRDRRAMLRRDLVQGATGKAALRQAMIDCTKTEGDWSTTLESLDFRQEPAQFRSHGGAVTHDRKGNRFAHRQ